MSVVDKIEIKPGLTLYPSMYSESQQRWLLSEIRMRAEAAGTPFATPKMPRTGKPMSVVQTNFGALGWVTDQMGGYRYQNTHVETGKPWAPIPDQLMELWDWVGYEHPPEACLVNYFHDPKCKLGLHVDADEMDMEAPIISVSLGSPCMFRVGGLQRNDPTTSFKVQGGDILVMAGPARRLYHGVDRVYFGRSEVVPGGGRVSLTLRRVTKAKRHAPMAEACSA